MIVAPCTTHNRTLPTEVVLEPSDDPVPQRCAVSLDSVLNIATGHLASRIETLWGMRMREVYAALSVAVDYR